MPHIVTKKTHATTCGFVALKFLLFSSKSQSLADLRVFL